MKNGDITATIVDAIRQAVIDGQKGKCPLCNEKLGQQAVFDVWYGKLKGCVCRKCWGCVQLVYSTMQKSSPKQPHRISMEKITAYLAQPANLPDSTKEAIYAAVSEFL